MLRVKDDVQIATDVTAKSLEVPNLMKDRRRDHENMFNSHRGTFRI